MEHLKATSFPTVERVEEQDPTKPHFWTAQRYPTADPMFPLVQIVQVRTPYGVVTAWQVWAGPGKWAFHTEAEALRFAAQRFGVGPYVSKTKDKTKE